MAVITTSSRTAVRPEPSFQKYL